MTGNNDTARTQHMDKQEALSEARAKADKWRRTTWAVNRLGGPKDWGVVINGWLDYPVRIEVAPGTGPRFMVIVDGLRVGENMTDPQARKYATNLVRQAVDKDRGIGGDAGGMTKRFTQELLATGRVQVGTGQSIEIKEQEGR